MDKPNLYDFLRRIQAEAGGPFGDVTITDKEWEWLEQFLQAPDHELHFKARKTGETETGEPIYAQDYAIAGHGVDVFCLLTEAMLQNGHFANMVRMAANFYRDHVPTCPDCKIALMNAAKVDHSWIFTPHKPV